MLDGKFDGKAFILPVRIYFEDTDLAGIVYHANYLRYMERARTEFFRNIGLQVTYQDGPEATAWAVRRLQIECLRPARIDDVVEVRSEIRGLGGARLSADQMITCRGEVLTRGVVEACIITLSGKPRRIPPAIRDKLLPFLCET